MLKNKELQRAYQKAWRLRNPEKFRASQNKYRKKVQAKVNAKQKEWRKNNPEKAKHYGLKHKHNISLDDYKLMEQKQNGMCAICLKKDNNLYVDHCHKTEIIRGLLCNSCNKALGLFYDSTESLKKAVEYLTKTEVDYVK